MIFWISSTRRTDKECMHLARNFGAKGLFGMFSRMWRVRVKLKWMSNKCFVRMWTGFNCPTKEEWGISKLQDTTQHNLVYWEK